MIDALPERKKIHTIESARGLAAVLVVLYHANLLCEAGHLRPFDSFFAFGDCAVDFFFVLSGFIMTWIHYADWGKPNRALYYLRRRFLRIYPTYWVATFLFSLPIILMPWIRAGDLSLEPVFFLKNVFLVPTTGYLVIPPAWTLQYEVSFYLLFSMLIFDRVVGVFVLVSWVAGILLASIVLNNLSFPYSFIFNPLNLQFLIGMICAFSVHKTPRRAGLVLFALGTLFFFGASISQVRAPWIWSGFVGDPFFGAIIKGVAAGMMIVGMVSTEINYRLKPGRLLGFLGTSSYSIYLVHLPCMVGCLLILIAFGILAELRAEFAFIVLAVDGVAAGAVFHRIVERPIVGLPRNYAPNSKTFPPK